MRFVHPVVAVITDGSGGGGQARLALTRGVCLEAGATIAPSFGVATDKDVYRAVLAGDTGFFVTLSDTLARTLVDAQIDAVAGDAIEGYNPTHDLCRMVIDRAVRLANRERPVANYAFAVVGSAKPRGCADEVVVRLDGPEVEAKLGVCRRYAEAAGGTLFAEVAAMLRDFDPDEFTYESLAPVVTRAAVAGKPFYETYGEQQVEAGRYDVVIRYDRHVAPIERALDA
jgi:hypothetical protein